jgi:hypothetical protein
MKTLGSGNDVQEILMRCAALEETDARRWGEMTVGQMVCHVRDAYAMALGEVRVARVRSGLRGPVGKWLAFTVPLRWPKNYGTVPELRQGMDAGSNFAAGRKGLMANLERFVAKREIVGDHPMFGPMTTAEWRRWGYLHADHHLRQFGR